MSLLKHCKDTTVFSLCNRPEEIFPAEALNCDIMPYGKMLEIKHTVSVLDFQHSIILQQLMLQRKRAGKGCKVRSPAWTAPEQLSWSRTYGILKGMRRYLPDSEL